MKSQAIMRVKVSKKIKALIEKRAAAEDCSPGKFVESLMRQKLQQEEKARLDQLLKEGLASGEAIVVDDAYWRDVEAQVKARIAHKNGRSSRRKAS
jgi:uncharacterized protein YoaH (UPF0181 family)